jgi:polyisoprenoid-binding protein YceI
MIEESRMTSSTTHPLIRIVDGAAVPAVGIWNIDPAHTSAEFVARHLMVTKVRGRFEVAAGSIEIAESLSDSHVDVVLDTASVSTGAVGRDNHVKSADFLDVENFPEMRFVSTDITPNGDSWAMTGDLTIKGITRPATLDLEFVGLIDDPWGNPKAAFSATGEILREDWGLNWNVALETGGVLVSKKITVEIEAQASPAA